MRRPETPQAVHLQSTGVNNNGYLSAMPGIEIFRLHGYIYTWTWRYIRKFVHPRLVDVGAHTVSAPFAVTSPVCTSSDGDDIAAKSVHAAQDLCISPVFPTLFVRPGRGCDMSFLWLMVTGNGSNSRQGWAPILFAFTFHKTTISVSLQFSVLLALIGLMSRPPLAAHRYLA